MPSEATSRFEYNTGATDFPHGGIAGKKLRLKRTARIAATACAFNLPTSFWDSYEMRQIRRFESVPVISGLLNYFNKLGFGP